MNLLLLIALLACRSQGEAVEGAAILRSVAWSANSDTLLLEFVFGRERPSRYRIGNLEDGQGRTVLRIDFQGARLDSGFRRQTPWWFGSSPKKDWGLGFRVELEQAVPWRARWKDDALRLEFADRIRHRPPWRNPWILGFAATGLAAGGVAVWLLSGDDSPQAEGDGGIPPPGFTFPK